MKAALVKLKAALVWRRRWYGGGLMEAAPVKAVLLVKAAMLVKAVLLVKASSFSFALNRSCMLAVLL